MYIQVYITATPFNKEVMVIIKGWDGNFKTITPHFNILWRMQFGLFISVTPELSKEAKRPQYKMSTVQTQMILNRTRLI